MSAPAAKWWAPDVADVVLPDERLAVSNLLITSYDLHVQSGLTDFEGLLEQLDAVKR